MTVGTPMEILQEALDGVERLIKVLKKKKSSQVRSVEEQQIVKAVSLAWFNNYRPNLSTVDESMLTATEEEYSLLFEYSSRATSRSKYQENLKRLKSNLLGLQSHVLSKPTQGQRSVMINEQFFSPLVSEPQMQGVLRNRLDEIYKCLDSGAPLSATIMMGGLLEALFLARVNTLSDKSPVFKAKASPKNFKTKEVLPLSEWTLSSYIDVGAELGWIRKPAKEIGVVLRDYRNFIHPERELSTGFTIIQEDALLFWEIFNQLARQIIKGVPKNKY